MTELGAQSWERGTFIQDQMEFIGSKEEQVSLSSFYPHKDELIGMFIRKLYTLISCPSFTKFLFAALSLWCERLTAELYTNLSLEPSRLKLPKGVGCGNGLQTSIHT